MTQCRVLNWSKAYAVIVSGARMNPYAHMLLNTGGPGGTYFQVAEVYGRPRFMNEGEFQQYLQENNKTIITVVRLNIPQPEKAQAKLEELLSSKWLWGVVVHNCESMVEEIVMAGGGPKLHKGLFELPIKATNECSPW